MNFYRRLSSKAKLRIAITCATLSIAAALVSSAALLLYLEEFPAVRGPVQPHESGPSIELTLVDAPELTKSEIMVITKSMSAVLTKRLPGYNARMRVIAYGAGAPIYIQLDGGLAGYLGDLDLFVVDVARARKAGPSLKLTALEAWSFIMGHEVTHLVQQIEGRARGASRGDTYHTDPLEREAFQEGFDLLSALKRERLQMPIGGVPTLTTSAPNPYTERYFIEQNPTVTIRTTWTLRGAAIRALRASGLWSS